MRAQSDVIVAAVVSLTGVLLLVLSICFFIGKKKKRKKLLNQVVKGWRLFKYRRLLELVDPLILDTCNMSEVLRTTHVGLLCVQNSPEDRPSMSSVVVMLSGEGTLPEPKEPEFFTERKLIESELFDSKIESCSINEVTITTMEVR